MSENDGRYRRNCKKRVEKLKKEERLPKKRKIVKD